MENEDQIKNRLDQLEKDLVEYNNKLKERETSLPRAFKTLIEDSFQFLNGKTMEFPKSALLGLFFAYLRPRMIMAVGGIITLLFTLFQVYILWNQNEILKSQNEFLEHQTRVSEQQAISFLISSLDPNDSISSEIAIAQIAEFGNAGFPTLIRLLHSQRNISFLSIRSLLGQAQSHTPEQFSKVLKELSSRYSYLYVDNYFGEVVEFREFSPKEKGDVYLFLIHEIGQYFSGLKLRAKNNREFGKQCLAEIKSNIQILRIIAILHYFLLENPSDDQHDTYYIDWHIEIYNTFRVISGRNEVSYPDDRLKWNDLNKWYEKYSKESLSYSQQFDLLSNEITTWIE